MKGFQGGNINFSYKTCCKTWMFSLQEKMSILFNWFINYSIPVVAKQVHLLLPEVFSLVAISYSHIPCNGN